MRVSAAVAAEFRKLIDYRGLVVNFPWGALVRLQLARAYAMQGDTAVMVFGALLLLLVIYFIRRDGLHHPRLAQFRAEDEAAAVKNHP